MSKAKKNNPNYPGIKFGNSDINRERSETGERSDKSPLRSNGILELTPISPLKNAKHFEGKKIRIAKRFENSNVKQLRNLFGQMARIEKMIKRKFGQKALIIS